jgi:hypothetical protein
MPKFLHGADLNSSEGLIPAIGPKPRQADRSPSLLIKVLRLDNKKKEI